jgi:hypothetical protein
MVTAAEELDAAGALDDEGVGAAVVPAGGAFVVAAVAGADALDAVTDDGDDAVDELPHAASAPTSAIQPRPRSM